MRTFYSLLLAPLFFFSACSSLSLDPGKFASQAADANRDESRIEKALHALCERGETEFCEKEARILLENGKGAAALQAAAYGCQHDRSSSCTLQGNLLLGDGKVEAAAKILIAACEAKSALDGSACTGAGEAAYLQGDAAKALRLWKRGCLMGNFASCSFEGKAHRLANRIAESLAPLRKACDGKIVGACTDLAISLVLDGKMDTALEKLGADCDQRSHRACRWLPLLEEKSKNKAMEKTLDQDCRRNNSLEACYDSTVLQFLRKGGRTLALYRWKENCKAGHKMSCWENYAEENGLRSTNQMNPDLEKFCQDGILAACYFRGLNFANQGRREEATPIWASACAKGEAWSCNALSESDGFTPAEKAKFKEQACALGMKGVCQTSDPALAEMTLASSKETKVDFISACANGDADACTYLAMKKASQSEARYQNGEVKEQLRKACLASSTLGCEGLVKSLE